MGQRVHDPDRHGALGVGDHLLVASSVEELFVGQVFGQHQVLPLKGGKGGLDQGVEIVDRTDAAGERPGFQSPEVSQ